MVWYGMDMEWLILADVMFPVNWNLEGYNTSFQGLG